MKKATIIALVIFLVGVILVTVIKVAKIGPAREKPPEPGTITDTVRMAGDNYLGYWFLRSSEMHRQMLEHNLGISFTDDGGAYADRLNKFFAGEYDAIVLPVNSYLQHGASHNFPGVIVASICESKGADGIVVFTDQVKDTNVINSLNNGSFKFVYTGASPSEFLLDLAIADFDFDQLKSSNTWRIEVGGSQEVYENAKKRNGDVFVLWEPDLSKALELPNAKYIWGSDKFSGYIVDVLVLRKDFLEKKRGAALNFLKAYFRTLDIYANNREKMLSEMSVSTALSKEAVEKMLKKIEWLDLAENCQLQFGIAADGGASANDGVVNTIIACTNVMVRTGRLGGDPLAGNPYLIIENAMVKELLKTGVYSSGSAKRPPVSFPPLSEEDWNKLREVGTMRVEPITFQAWDNFLSEDEKGKIDELAKMLINNYPNYRVVVRGHTGPSDDEGANLKLSLERAEVIMQRLIAVHGIDPDRLKAEGVGSRMPPARKPNESPREYRYRLSRVEIILFEPNPL